ncbi:hepatitis A virus cellular receptor 1 homolog [Dendropsophus ebraccatus]|uniref:hepatitis A virus cellular receptor 1 homolog n=1 Tax=Dendropsophus ebraccatus TaxID=150705 RepID=UPI003831AF83
MSCLKTLRIYILILYFSGLAVSGDVTGSVNDTLTLPCTYSDHTNLYFMCWGRGKCSWRSCNDEGIIWTYGYKVTGWKSDRYQLKGNTSQGDVSLTITRTDKQDEGTYCCYVTGQLNDLRKEITVNIKEDSEVRKLTTDGSTEVTTITDSMDSREQTILSIANIIRLIIILLLPPLFHPIYKFCSLQPY